MPDALYSAVVAVHVVLVVFSFGTLFAYPWLPAGEPGAHLARARLLTVTVERGGLGALAAGLVLAADRSAFGQVWVLVPLGVLIVVTGVTGSLIIPRERRLGTGAPHPGDVGVVRRAAIGSAVLVAVAVVFMVAKPGNTDERFEPAARSLLAPPLLANRPAPPHELKSPGSAPTTALPSRRPRGRADGRAPQPDGRRGRRGRR